MLYFITYIPTSCHSKGDIKLINIERLLNNIENLAKIGATSEGGVSRLSFTKNETLANDFVEQLMKNAGMETTKDAIGNVIGTYRRSEQFDSPLIIGSHIDTVPNGGKYDGALGVLTAIEVIHTMHEHNISYARPIKVIAFKDEEGCRFGVGMLGSSAVIGGFDYSLLDVKDANDVTISEAMVAQGYNPDDIHLCKIENIYAYLELHIEQGRVLESKNLPVGVVTGIAGPIWFEVTVEGIHEHAGATPMHLRNDALAGAAEMLLEIEAIANRYENGVATVGKLEIQNAGINVIPGKVSFICDLRHIDENERDAMERQITEKIHHIAEKRQLNFSIKDLQRISPVLTDSALVEKISHAVEKVGVTPFQLSSGAGHDAMLFAGHCPIGMIFVRTKDGISHNPVEYASPEDIQIGAEVLLETVLGLKVENSVKSINSFDFK